MVFGIELEVERKHLINALRAILHTIFFHRAFGKVRAFEVNLDFIDVTYPRVSALDVERSVDEKIAAFERDMDQGNKMLGQLTLSFFEKVTKTRMMIRWEDLECWETWAITIKIDPALTGDKDRRNEKLENDLNRIILQIIKEANDRKTSIPPITPTNSTPDSVTPFPYKIEISSNPASWGKVFKEVIKTTPPGFT